MRGKTWRHRLFDHRADPPDGGTVPSAAAAPSAPVPAGAGGQRVWAFLCPNPLCDTELVIFPEYADSLVECPTCGFAFVAPRAVPLQIVPESEPGSAPAGRAFAPGAVMARPGGAAGRPRARGIPAPLPPPRAAPPDRHTQPSRDRSPGAASAETGQGAGAVGSPLAPAPASPKAADAADALDAFAHGAPLSAGARGPGHGATPTASAPHPADPPPGAAPCGDWSRAAPSSGTPPAGAPASGVSPGADGPVRSKPADTEALRALARAAADEAAHGGAKRGGAAKPKGLGATLASATLEGERRRAARIRTAAEAAAARDPAADVSAPAHTAADAGAARAHTAADAAAGRPAGPVAAWQSAVPDGPLSEGERAAARQRRTDLVVTWVVAAVVSAALALAAYLTGVPDIGLGALLFVGLAGLRTYWIGRAGRKDVSPPRP